MKKKAYEAIREKKTIILKSQSSVLCILFALFKIEDLSNTYVIGKIKAITRYY